MIRRPGTQPLPISVAKLIPDGWEVRDHRGSGPASIRGNMGECISLRAPDPHTGGLAQYWVTMDLHRRVFALGPGRPKGMYVKGVESEYFLKQGWLFRMTTDAIAHLQEFIDSHYVVGSAASGLRVDMGRAREAIAGADATRAAESAKRAQDEEQLW